MDWPPCTDETGHNKSMERRRNDKSSAKVSPKSSEEESRGMAGKACADHGLVSDERLGNLV
jgi:hypothetical protein